jgi:hypothetical protein
LNVIYLNTKSVKIITVELGTVGSLIVSTKSHIRRILAKLKPIAIVKYSLKVSLNNLINL